MIMLDMSLFPAARDKAIATSDGQGGIGTYGERLVHKSLKYFLEPDDDNHEVAIYGSVADIRNEKGIFEIQTRSFNKLLPKLERFLLEERVTVVCPIIENKYIVRTDTETGESTPPRRSPKRGRPSDALAEISMIRRFIPNDNLTVLVMMLDADEIRMMKGRTRIGRKTTSKINTIPISLNSIIELKTAADYRALLPDGLSDGFTQLEFESISGLRRISAHGALMLLLQLGIITRERQGREAYKYYFC